MQHSQLLEFFNRSFESDCISRGAARLTFDERRKQLLQTETQSTNLDSDHPQHLVCPLTLDLFKDPVLSPVSSNTFERAAIADHLQRSQTDPMNREQLTEDQLLPNR